MDVEITYARVCLCEKRMNRKIRSYVIPDEDVRASLFRRSRTGRKSVLATSDITCEQTIIYLPKEINLLTFTDKRKKLPDKYKSRAKAD